MEKKGLCTTCVQFDTCTFIKEPPVWQCEEFSTGNHTLKSKSVKVERVVREAATDSE